MARLSPPPGVTKFDLDKRSFIADPDGVIQAEEPFLTRLLELGCSVIPDTLPEAANAVSPEA